MLGFGVSGFSGPGQMEPDEILAGLSPNFAVKRSFLAWLKLERELLGSTGRIFVEPSGHQNVLS